MPTYEYRCDSCDKNFDVVQSFHDDPLTDCPTCGSPVRKVFGNVGIVFKGSGFYKTDSRNGGSGKKETEATPRPAPGPRLGARNGDGSQGVVKGRRPADKPSTDSVKSSDETESDPAQELEARRKPRPSRPAMTPRPRRPMSDQLAATG